MREASKNYQGYRESLDSFNTSYVSSKMKNVLKDKAPECRASNLEKRETLRKEVTASVTKQTDAFKFKEDRARKEHHTEEEDEETEDGVSSAKECKGLLGYFFLAKLFA